MEKAEKSRNIAEEGKHPNRKPDDHPIEPFITQLEAWWSAAIMARECGREGKVRDIVVVYSEKHDLV